MIKGSQKLDLTLLNLKEEVLMGSNIEFKVASDEILHYKGRLGIANDEGLWNQIL